VVTVFVLVQPSCSTDWTGIGRREKMSSKVMYSSLGSSAELDARLSPLFGFGLGASREAGRYLCWPFPQPPAKTALFPCTKDPVDRSRIAARLPKGRLQRTGAKDTDTNETPRRRRGRGRRFGDYATTTTGTRKGNRLKVFSAHLYLQLRQWILI